MSYEDKWNYGSNYGAADIDASYAHAPMAGRLEQAEDVERFMLAGSATLTLVSTRTGDRFTYKVAKSRDFNEDRPIWFVSLLNGPDNEGDFAYIGNIRPDNGAGHASYRYEHGRKARVPEHATSVVAWIWFSRHLFERDDVPEGIEVWHEGRCGRCNRKLTVPESIESGFGPECINYV